MKNINKQNNLDHRKKIMKEALQAALDLLNEKEEDVVHDYGKSSVDAAADIIDAVVYCERN